MPRIEYDAFTRGYIEAALWSSSDDEGNALDGRYHIGDISRDTLLKMVSDCAKFQEQFGQILTEAYGEQSKNFTPDRAGFCFWLNRNGHGSGFWDESELLPAAQKALNEAAHSFGEHDLYIGDDGLIYGG